MNAPGIAPVRIGRPRLAKVFQRHRLFRRLDALRDHAIVWVTSPAGSGKTTLVGSYLAARQLRGLWMQLEPGDKDLATYFYYLGQSVLRAAPRRSQKLPLFTEEYSASAESFARRFFEQSCRRLKPPAFIVFDNYQEVPFSAPLHRVLAQGLTAVPHGIRIFILSRDEPPPEFVRWRVEGKLAVLPWAELRLTLRESRGIARARGGAHGRLGPYLDQLVERSQGWAAGLVLLLEQAGSGGMSGASPREDARLVFDYFAEELFRGLEAQVREFLLMASVLPSFTAAALEDLTGRADASSLLTWLERGNWFTFRNQHPEGTYQFHPLFREFLLARAADTLSPPTLQRLRSKAAGVQVEAGNFDDAASLLQAAADWDSLADLSVRLAPSLLAQGRYQPLIAWLQDLPTAVLQARPWLQYWLGNAHLPVDAPKARHLLTSAFHRFEAEKDVAGLYSAWAALVGAYNLPGDRVGGLEKWVERLDALLTRYPRIPDENLEVEVYLAAFGTVGWGARPLRRFPKMLERCEALLAARQNVDLRTLRHLVLFTRYLANTGKHETYRRILRKMNWQELKHRKVEPAHQIQFLLVDSYHTMHLILAGSVREAATLSVQSAQAGLELADATGFHMYDLPLLRNFTSSSIMAGDLAGAERSLARTRALVGDAQDQNRAWLLFQSAGLRIRQGKNAEARALLLEALELGSFLHGDFLTWPILIALANAEASLGLLPQAKQRVGRILLSLRRVPSRRWHSACVWMRARIACLEGNRKRAQTHLTRLSRISRGEFYPLLTIPEEALASLCALALGAGIAENYFRRTVEIYDLAPPLDERTPDNWPWRMRITTLGSLHVVAGNRTLPLAEGKGRPLALLKAVLASDGRSASAEALAETLWPDAEGDAAAQSFATTLHRLRRMLGVDVLLLKDGWLSLNPGKCWLDVNAFEASLARAAAALGAKNARRAAAEVADALKLYRGPFLVKEEARADVARTRRRLQGLLVMRVQDVGAALKDAGDSAGAAELYREALAVVPAAEALSQCLIAAVLERGDTRTALMEYERCAEALRREEGREPARESESLRRTILTRLDAAVLPARNEPRSRV